MMCGTTEPMDVVNDAEAGTLSPRKLRSWAAMISSPAPAVKPTTTVCEMKFVTLPRRASPRPSLMAPMSRFSVSARRT